MNILIVDDEQVALTTMKLLLKRRGFKDVAVCDNGREAIDTIKAQDLDIVLLDVLMPEVDGLQVLEDAKPYKPHTEFIVLTAVDDLATAVKAVRFGAYDYLVKPVDNERLILTIEHAYERIGLLAGRAHDLTEVGNMAVSTAFFDTITHCGRMKDLLAYSETMARGGNPVLITGESGTGKELLARGIHRASPMAGGPFVAVNLASIPESLFESQVFGHIKGAFTGAEKDHPGYFQQANGGTLFLDEIGEIPLHLQVKLLRVLEEKAVTPIGATKPVSLDVRIISATNRDIDKACREGAFRLDLMYRLNSARIRLPPLRERDGDIPVLADHFLKVACKRHNKDIRGFSPEAMEQISRGDFPGNMRELAQVVENAVLLSSGGIILPEPSEMPAETQVSSEAGLCSLREAGRRHILRVLEHTNGNRKAAARILGLSVRQLRRRLSQMRNGSAPDLQ